ncbi:MAG: GHKL domain-containing protein [Bacteroidota bacterium]|nr:GHKL domain-containing protein [Bacteroidota bacterium]
MTPITIEELKKVVALSDLPDLQLQWILDHSDYHEYSDGGLIAKYGDQAEVMWFLLEGKISFYMNINGRQVYYYTFENSSAIGGVGGLMPYSRMKTYPGYSYANGYVRLIRLHKDYFQELEQLNPDFIQKLIGYMTERARSFATTKLQHEKVNALGNLAAGIAHELNNPAAAINSTSNELSKRLERNYELTEKLIQCNMTAQQIQAIRALVQKKETESTNLKKRSVMQRLGNEDEIEEWLENKNVPESVGLAETFSEFGISTEELENLAANVEKDAFISVVQWLDNLLSSYKIIKDLGEASSRISHLVGAIKSHVHMDQSNELQPTDVHHDIENTLTLLGYKLREKNIMVKKIFCENPPEIPAYVGELNQVWTNIIDNAIFALQKNGEIIIETTCNAEYMDVKIIDNGSGIPSEILSRIFDPFFTTKKVGEGTGIGLDLVQRIIKRHNGDIKVDSNPGRTEFSIWLPVTTIKKD